MYTKVMEMNYWTEKREGEVVICRRLGTRYPAAV
jgi:hypothetical protein